ncbi:MAG: efflux RND transporter periplasmic adaptor subunit, partial [Verrucomicrobiota bacterium]
RVSLVLGVLAAGTLLYITLIKSAPEPTRRPAIRSLPLVQTRDIALQDYAITLSSQGILSPKTRTQLTAEVGGKVASVSPTLSAGSRFARGDILLTLDSADYQTRLERARSALIRAETAFSLAEAESDKAKADWERFGRGAPSDLALKIPQLREAEASLQSAETDVAEAQRNVARCQIAAPYAGRVLRKAVDVGQFVNPGTLLGEIYATDVLEVRLPLREDQLSAIDLPRPGNVSPKASAWLQPNLGEERKMVLPASVSRTEAEIDSLTRQLFIIAEVTLASLPNNSGPLPIGTFVEAKVQGKTLEDVLVIPRVATRSGNQVVQVMNDNTLRFRSLDLLYQGDPDVLVAKPHPHLPPGSRISVTPLPFSASGDAVNVVGDEPALPPPGSKGKGKGKGKGRQAPSAPEELIRSSPQT